MIRSLLIANHDEIACRIIRTARRLGIRAIPMVAATLLGACAADAQAPWQPHSLAHGGVTRIWHEVVPPACADPGARCPVLVTLHGGGGRTSGQQFAGGTGLAAAGATRGYIVVAPDALGGNWNDGRPEMAAGIDDVGFIRSALADLRRRAGIDPDRIFATGASNGGLMSFRLACAGGFRAVAPVIANMGAELIERCRPAGTVSVFMIPGTADRLMPYEGGAVAPGLRNRGTVVSSDRTIDFWRIALGCGSPPRTERFDPVSDETSVAITRYEACRGGAVVQRWAVEGGGHAWPGRAGRRRPLLSRLVGPTATEFSATEAILDFFDAVGRTP